MGEPERESPLSLGGEPRADFAHAVRAYAAPLLRYCQQRLGDRHLAEDAVQETFLRTYRSLSEQAPEKLGAWLFGVARNCCLELARAGPRAAAEASATAEAVAQTKSENFGLAELEVALERLDDAERSLVFLKHVEGLKCREIAALTGQPLGTVTGNLARTYRKLRRSLQAGRGGA